MRTAPSARRAAPALGLLLALAGCGEPAPAGRLTVHPARGVVTLQGQPLADANVVLRPAGDAAGDRPTPTGRTGPDGTFQLMTYEAGDGAPAGDYLVGIAPATPSETSFDPFKNAAAKVKVAPKGPPRKYADPATSGLKATIKEGDNEIPSFDLK